MQPIALNLGSFSLHWYGVLIAIGFALGLWTAARRAPLAGIQPETIADIGPWLILGALIGARGLFVASYWNEYFAAKPFYEIFMIQHGGLIYYGGLIGASLAFIIFALRKKLPLWNLADVVTPSIALGYVFGRLGCFMNGCCYGRPSNLPWAIQFPSHHETHPQHLHPSQIYDSALSLGLYFGLAWLYRHRKFDGQVFVVYLVAYALLRSFIELFRGDYPRYILGWLTPAHLVSLLILTIGTALWLWRKDKKVHPA